jgi:hypothetical protein
MSLLPEQAAFKKISFENIVKELINNSKWIQILIKKNKPFHKSKINKIYIYWYPIMFFFILYLLWAYKKR